MPKRGEITRYGHDFDKGGLRLCALMQKWPLIEPGESIYQQFFTSLLL